MGASWASALLALFVWWFSTGAILMVVKHADQRGPAARLWSVMLALPLVVVGAWGFLTTMAMATPQGVTFAFLAALAIWGWIELAFLLGIVTGPNTRICPENIPEWERFLRAWGTIAYHELLLILVLVVMAIAAYDAPNPFGLWTFAVLFFARISAKLNLFFGVPRINLEFLPTPLAHLPSHFRIASPNWIYPISITMLALAVGCWLERWNSSLTLADAAGYALLAALTALALLEHWFMVLPLPDAKLWRWMLPKPPVAPKSDPMIREDAHGL